MYRYKAYGLIFQSEFECLQLMPDSGTEEADVQIVPGQISDKLKNAREEGSRYQSAPGHFRLKVDNIAKFEVRDGKKITVEKDPAASMDDVRLFLYSTPFGALLQQRGFLTLHASGIQMHGKGILFCGTSGSGKSTLANYFVSRGASFITDDIAAVKFNEDKKAEIHPGFPAIQLWADAIKLSGIDKKQCVQTREAIEKYYHSVDDKMAASPTPIDNIYIISQCNDKELEAETVTGIEKFNAVKNQTFRYPLVKGHDKKNEHFKLAAPLAQQASIVRLKIPRKPFNLVGVADLVKKDLAP